MRPSFLHKAFIQGNAFTQSSYTLLSLNSGLSWASWDFTTFFKGTLTLAEGDKSINCSFFFFFFQLVWKLKPEAIHFLAHFFEIAGSCSRKMSSLCSNVNSAVCVFVLQMMNKVFGGTVHKKSVREDGVFSIGLDNTCSLFR